MSGGWQHVRLGDLVKIKHGWPYKSEYFSDTLTGRPIVVAVGNFQYTGGFRFETTNTKEYSGPYPKEYELEPGDILLVMTCQTSGGEILGIPAKIPADGRKYLHNQRLGKVIVRDPKAVDKEFLYWVFLWSEFNRELVASASGTKIVHTAPSRIEEFRFELPRLSHQRAIARILGALDEKIEVNRRMNRTLEAMAQALFRSWFVDFDPVTSKAAGHRPFGMDPVTARCFPERFDVIEGEQVPSGWAMSRLGEHVELQRGRTYKSGLKGMPGPFLLGLASIRPNGGFRSDNLSTYGGDSPENLILRPGDLYVSLKDVTQSADLLGATARVPTYICMGRLTQDTVKLAFGKSSISTHLVFESLKTQEYRDYCRNRATGTTNLGLSRDDFLSYRVPLPSSEVQAAFDRTVGPLYKREDLNVTEALALEGVMNSSPVIDVV